MILLKEAVMRFLFIFCSFMLLFSAAVSAQETMRVKPLYSDLEKAAATRGSKEVFTLIERNAGSADNKTIIIQWLFDRAWTRMDPEPFYLLYYSDFIFEKAQAADSAPTPPATQPLYTALLFLRAFEALALTDAARCEDKTVMDTVAYFVRERYNAIQGMKTKVSKEDKAKIRVLALTRELRMVNRPPNLRICYIGQRGMTAADARDAAKGTDQPAPVYAPKLIGNDLWNQRRELIHKKINERKDE